MSLLEECKRNNGPCDLGLCQSPITCSMFGYCRERNFKQGYPDEIQKQRWQDEWKLPTFVGMNFGKELAATGIVHYWIGNDGSMRIIDHKEIYNV